MKQTRAQQSSTIILAVSTTLNLCFFVALLSGNAEATQENEFAQAETSIPEQIETLRSHLRSISPQRGVIVLQADPVDRPVDSDLGPAGSDKTRRMIVISPDLFRYQVQPSGELAKRRGLGLEMEARKLLSDHLDIPAVGEERDEQVDCLVLGPDFLQVASDVHEIKNNADRLSASYEGIMSLQFNNMNGGLEVSHVNPLNPADKVASHLTLGRKSAGDTESVFETFPTPHR